jgi:hypothetical protein
MNKEIITPNILEKYGLKGVHEAANIMPPMTPDEFQGLRTSISERGMLNAIKTTPNGLLLEGRHRLLIAYELNITPKIETVKIKDPLLWVIDQNIHRRSLTTGQRAAIGSALASLKLGSNQFQTKSVDGQKATPADGQKATEDSGIPLSSATLKQAAKESGASIDAIKRFRVVEQYAPSAAKQIWSGTVSLNAAYEIAVEKKADALIAEMKAKANKSPKISMGMNVVEDPSISLPPKTKQQELPNIFKFMDLLATDIRNIFRVTTTRWEKLNDLIRDRAFINDRDPGLRDIIEALKSVAREATEFAAKLESPKPAAPKAAQPKALPQQ